MVRPTSIWGPWFEIPYRTFFDATARGRYLHPRGRKVRKSFGYVGNTVYQLDRLMFAEGPKVLGDKHITKLRRADIVALLDKVQDERGAPMADNTLMVIRRICNWHAARDDEFRSSIVRGMGRSNPGETRTRILTDDEI
jgi:hypothetical protein